MTGRLRIKLVPGLVIFPFPSLSLRGYLISQSQHQCLHVLCLHLSLFLSVALFLCLSLSPLFFVCHILCSHSLCIFLWECVFSSSLFFSRSLFFCFTLWISLLSISVAFPFVSFSYLCLSLRLSVSVSFFKSVYPFMSFCMHRLFLSVSVCLCFSVCPSLCVSLSGLWVCSPNSSLAFYVSIFLNPNLYLSVWSHLFFSVSLTLHTHTHTHTHTHRPLYISVSVFPCFFSQRSSNDRKIWQIISGHVSKRYLPVLPLSV